MVGHSNAERVVMMRASIAVSMPPLKIYRCMVSVSLAPKRCAIGMAKPWAMPIQKPRMRNWTLLDAPTEARALGPRVCPTMAASAML